MKTDTIKTKLNKDETKKSLYLGNYNVEDKKVVVKETSSDFCGAPNW